METESDLTQDPTTTEGLEQENAVETTQENEEATVAPAPEEVGEAEAAALEEQAAPAEEDGVIVATEDVAPAQSKIELARIAKESLIERAKELLVSTDMKLSNIAMEIGYNEPNYFSHVFRKSEGMTPKEYRTLYARGGGEA